MVDEGAVVNPRGSCDGVAERLEGVIVDEDGAREGVTIAVAKYVVGPV